MKKILITGANSYIGMAFEDAAKKKGYAVKTVDTIGDAWKETDFSEYDVVFNVAGIAHVKETEEITPLYYKVNRDLVLEIAKKARESGVKKFIALSSMSVYGKTTGHIKENTPALPTSGYGKSKLQADEELIKMNCDDFKVCILRPPMVYGKNCKGNYQTLAKFAKKTFVFPKVFNERSMIHIDNLCEFVCSLAERNQSGYFLPQDSEYVNTSEMVKYIAEANGRKIYFTRIFNPFIKILKVSVINKVFGSLTYEKKDYGFDYHIKKKLKEAVFDCEI